MGSDDWLAIVDRQATEGTWTYGLLYDFRQLSEPVPLADSEIVAARVREHSATKGARGPLAIVGEVPDVLRGSEGYAFVHKDAGIQLEVFWNVEEAERWLDSLPQR